MIKEVIIIGNGLAGMSAAIFAAKAGAHVMLVSETRPERTQSVLAAGGINCALNNNEDNDDTNQHYADTMKSAGCLADSTAVKQLTQMAPEIIKWLSDIGVVFSRTKDGKIAQRYFGGQKKARTVYAKAGIGKQLISGLSMELNRCITEGTVKEYIGYGFDHMLIDDQQVYGCQIQHAVSRKKICLYGTAVIVASGGINGLFGKTTGSTNNQGYVTAKLLSQGVQMANLEMIQFHPTTIETPMKQMLISEAARGEGGRLFVQREGKPWYFTEELYPDGGNLMPRDVVSMEEYRQSVLEGYGQVYLDLTGLSKETIEDKLKEVKELCETYLGIDPAVTPIPVQPGIHYFMGGIFVDARHQTNVKGLYAAGECACIYHGANRLGGNSTLGAIVGGKIAGGEAARWENPYWSKRQRESFDFEEKINQAGGTNMESPSDRLQHVMRHSMTILRDEQHLQKGLSVLLSIEENSPAEQLPYLKLGEACVRSALDRKESRGAHRRVDFPETKQQYENMTIARMDEQGELIIERRETSYEFAWEKVEKA